MLGKQHTLVCLTRSLPFYLRMARRNGLEILTLAALLALAICG
jgi:hypothetical protein